MQVLLCRYDSWSTECRRKDASFGGSTNPFRSCLRPQPSNLLAHSMTCPNSLLRSGLVLPLHSLVGGGHSGRNSKPRPRT